MSDAGYHRLKRRSWLDWPTVEFGWRHGLASKSNVIDFAVRCLQDSHDEIQELAELAAADHEDDDVVTQLLTAVASKHPRVQQLDKTTKNRWRLVELEEARDQFKNDPERLLKHVAAIYARFGYPDDMEAAVYYMPPRSASDAEIGDVLESPLKALDALIDALHVQLT